MTPDDWRELRALRLAALADAPTAYGSNLAFEAAFTDEEWQAKAADHYAGETTHTEIAIGENGEPLGIAAVFLEAEHPEWAKVFSVWVAPSARRTGLARSLMKAMIGWALERRCDRVTLMVTTGNTAAEQLYASLGFSFTERVIPHRSQPGMTMREMERSLIAL